jgi:hypothetical protein
MPLSRLDNFLKNVRGNILYVDPNSLDSTDVVENQGNSMARPFKTLQRALIEASRFSYQKGLDNDRFEKTTIMLAPGNHYIDNRPGLIPDGSNNFRTRAGTSTNDLAPFTSSSVFDIFDSNNILYKLNSIYGGVIVPRGVSIVGQDLRKSKIRPLYVPSPTNDNIERSAIFRVTGATYFNSFTIFDADPTKNVYTDYTTSQLAPNFSHHKLTAFEYADGANDVSIDDAFITDYKTDRSDLTMYYEKVGLVYGPGSGREIEPDYPSSGVDIQTKTDEFRIVGPTGGSIGITSIKAGDGSTSTETITVNLEEGLNGLNVDTRVIIDGVTSSGYNGSFLVTEVLTVDDDGDPTSFTYDAPNPPTNALPSPSGSTVSLSTNTVSSASPYVFNVSMRSVLGLCGMHADGSKVTGFKSMSVAQFTGVSLQTDNNAFVKYNSTSGSYDDSTTVDNLQNDSGARYKPSYSNFHIKASNKAFIQLVSIFAIGFSEQFVVESGGDFSVTNSNSNFGQSALRGEGFRDEAFTQDDVGYITNIIPPQQNITENTTLEYNSIDVSKTVSVGDTTRLYLYNETNLDAPPSSVIQGYRIGAKVDDKINLLIPSGGSLNNYYAKIIMPDTQSGISSVTSVKVSTVGRNVSTGNSISGNTLTFTEDHNFLNGETVRIFSDNTRIPDGLENNRVYFAITDGVNSDQIKFAQTFTDAVNGNQININNFGGILTVESRVSDKKSGDLGHPLQFDTTNNQWYLNVSGSPTDNTLFSIIDSLGVSGLGEATSRTYIERTPDKRGSEDRIYKYRYVIPSQSGITSARPPQDGFILEKSNDVTGATDTEVELQFNPNVVTMNNLSEMRNFSFLSGAEASSGSIEFQTELPHKLSIGNKVTINNVTSTNFTVGTAGSGFNGEYTVTGISSAKSFTVSTDKTGIGSFTNNTSQRTTSLPTFKISNLQDNFYIYRSQQVSEYIKGEQDGVYYLTLLNSSNKPSVSPFNDDFYNFSQPVSNLYPQYDRDNPNSDPEPSISYALPDRLGEVVINDPKDSITNETVQKYYFDTKVGTAITDFVINATGTGGTIFTSIDHGMNRITKVSIASSGSNYGNGTGLSENLYNAKLTGSSTGVNATARVTVDSSGGLTDVEIMDGGTSYVVGDTLSVVGVATTTGFTAGTVTVDNIYDNTGDAIVVQGITSTSYSQYNQVYKITGISTSREIQVNTSSTITTGISGSGIGNTVTSESLSYLVGPTLDIVDLTYDSSTGISTIRTSQRHGLRSNNKIKISGRSSEILNDEFLVLSVDNDFPLTRFQINVGVTTTTVTTGTGGTVFPLGLSAQGGSLGLYDENFGGRVVNTYAGITTALSVQVTSTTSDQISIENLDDFDFKIGDYLRIDDEIMRIKSTVTTNPVSVFRGIFGTIPTTHDRFSTVRRINIEPIEFRRPSIIRASGHTFEYLGFGPGNYSTALPQKQDRELTLKEELNAQALQTNGGITNFTGMNDDGDFFIGNKKTSSVTGTEEVYDTPVQTVTGEDVSSIGVQEGSSFNIGNFSSLAISNSIKIEGGRNKTLLSEFDGPVVFTEKVTSTSEKGIEANSIFLQGDTTVSRNVTVGISTPTSAGNPGDIVFNANPTRGNEVGWVYTLENDWYPFGNINVNTETNSVTFDSVGIATTSSGDCTLKVGSGTSLFCVDSTGVGIGTTANGYKLHVDGTIKGSFVGDGSGILNLPTDSLWTLDSGNIYPNGNREVGIGTTVPTGLYSLELGTTGTGKTDLYVRNKSRFIGEVNFEDKVTIDGKLTSSSFDLDDTSGDIRTGIITTTTLKVGTSNLIAGSSGVGIGTGTVRSAKLDIEGATRFKTYYEIPRTVSSSSGVVTVDLSLAQTFLVTTTENITQFRLINVPSSSSTAFTIKITQGSTGRTVDIDNFRDASSSPISLYWPGGVAPTVTITGGATDIYSFMTFDGGNSLYGVVGGQNFS